MSEWIDGIPDRDGFYWYWIKDPEFKPNPVFVAVRMEVNPYGEKVLINDDGNEIIVDSGS